MKPIDAIDQRIAASFAKHEADPTNGAISKKIATLFMQKSDYASALAWYEHAFEAGGRIDSALENTIDALKSRGDPDSN